MNINLSLFALVLKSPDGEWPITYTFTFTKPKAGVFKLLHFEEEVFQKSPFRDVSVVWTVGATVEFKLRLKIRDSEDAAYKVVVSPSISYPFCLTHEVPDSNEVYLPFV